jgi:hypothetical protein
VGPEDLEVVSVAEFGRGVQAWVGPNAPDETLAGRPAPTPGPRAKPADGFFTSSWDGRSCAWLEFMHAEYLGAEGTRSSHGYEVWLLTPEPDATLYVIDSLEDYQRLTDAYPKGWDDAAIPERAPDWYRISDPATRIDGVLTSAPAVAAGRMPPEGRELRPFTGWDVESTLWFGWPFVSQEYRGGLRDDWTLATKGSR